MSNDRATDLLEGISRQSRILELGPSVSPMAPRSAGWDVTVIDHATQEELIEKYKADPNVNVGNIEKVDYVWQNGPLHEVVPADMLGKFDVLIASHVIEHLPNPIGFMQSASRLLNPASGILALAVPDKRWCFDSLKQVSSTGEFLAAYRTNAQRHSLSTRFNHSAYIAFDHGRGGWGREVLTDLKLADTLDHAYVQFQDWTDDPAAPYVDCHAWHFTPASFELLILEAACLGLLDWRISWLRPQAGVEFFARLVPGRQQFASVAERDNRRLELLKQILLDLREQSDFMIASIPGQASAPLYAMLDPETRGQLREIAETAAQVRTALRPGQAVWHGLLPLRQRVAKLRGRA